MRSRKEDQVRTLQAHISLSNESGKPMVVHVRDAWPEVLRVLDEGSAERVVIHCFSGDAAIARSAPSAGIGSASPATSRIRRTNTSGRRRALWTSTASSWRRTRPFLAPQTLRGTDNEPANVIHTIAEVARIRDEDVRSVSEATSRNADAAFFGLS